MEEKRVWKRKKTERFGGKRNGIGRRWKRSGGNRGRKIGRKGKRIEKKQGSGENRGENRI
jgi:hypothetical protein